MPPEASATPIYWPWLGAPASPSTIKGSYDHYMMRNLLNQERATRQEFRELIAELRDKRREEIKLAAEDGAATKSRSGKTVSASRNSRTNSSPCSRPYWKPSCDWLRTATAITEPTS